MLQEQSRAALQEAQYAFPYHHIPHFEPNGNVSLTRRLPWGLRYLCYQLHLREMVLGFQPESVLDLGCGDGVFVGGLPGSIRTRVGVDLSERAISFARAFHPECVFHAKDAADLTEQFDVVVAIEVLEHVPDDHVSDFLSTMAQRVRPGGVAVISVPTTIVPLTAKHFRHYDRPLIQQQLAESGADLKIEKIEFLFAKPWWFEWLRWSISNRVFRLEVRPILQYAWRRIWNEHRFATEDNGSQMVVVLRRS